ncbi:MAG: hypothetical protein HYY30_14055 [Chloroflexi bacterium]|nr:hypothetical protein [Chloroflexota bacterium]
MPDTQEFWEIRVAGHLDIGWSQWFDELAVTNVEGGETVLFGGVPDQAALHGLLARIRDLNLTLISAKRVSLEELTNEHGEGFWRTDNPTTR